MSFSESSYPGDSKTYSLCSAIGVYLTLSYSENKLVSSSFSKLPIKIFSPYSYSINFHSGFNEKNVPRYLYDCSGSRGSSVDSPDLGLDKVTMDECLDKKNSAHFTFSSKNKTVEICNEVQK
jgi:hypothetical protein